jgi:hypothetical protein
MLFLSEAVFDSMTSDLSGSRIPVVQIHLQHGSLKLSQRQLNGAESASPLAIPIEIVDDSEKKFRTVLNTTNRTLERVVSYAIAKPIAYARFIYNVREFSLLLKSGSDHFN